jgi:CO/xanthine dehydrogenase Mo-binding subunit
MMQKPTLDKKTMKLNRRQFIILTGQLSGMSLLVYYGPSLLSSSDKKINEQGWMKSPGQAKSRFDGYPKVTGQKLYGVDLRSRDLNDWPEKEAHGVIIRASLVDKIFTGFKLDDIPSHPTRIITAQDLKNQKILVPPLHAGNLFVAQGESPDYLGQALGIFIFDDFDAFLEARPYLNKVATYGKMAAEKPLKEPYAHERIIKYTKNHKIIFSSVIEENFMTPPYPEAKIDGDSKEKAIYYANLIEEETKNDIQVTGNFSTQSIDPMFMEPEGGLSWYEKKTKTLHLAFGTQSPIEDSDFCGYLFSHDKTHLDTVKLTSCYPGGGFGGKDHSIFCLYMALGAFFHEGKPIRIVNTRFEQFQSGIKRHSSHIKETLSFEPSGKLVALKATFDFHAGGLKNLSMAVPVVAADNAASAYFIPQVDIELTSKPTIGVTAGSMRGFGSLQTQFVIESLMDEASVLLKIDPIELRLKNITTKDKTTLRGGQISHAIYTRELLEEAKKHPLWLNRHGIKEKSTKDQLFGVGFAMAMKSYGTTSDVCLGSVGLRADGTIEVKTSYVDMGNGSATMVALACADFLGQNATHVSLGNITEFLKLKQFSAPYNDQSELERLSLNPRFTPQVSMSTAASAGSYFVRHSILTSSKILFEHSIWPIAQSLWGYKAYDITQTKWVDSKLTYPGYRDLSLKEIALELYKTDLALSFTVHGYYRNTWSQGEFNIFGKKTLLPVDGLGFETKNKGFVLLDRLKAFFPPVKNKYGREDRFTPCASLCGISVIPSTGEVKVTDMYSFLDCGLVIQKELIEGQSEGAVAMGIGQALYEYLPVTLGGPGEGGFNLHN